jgi:diguanylate cyclase (GGDEF)-like protein/PAS domain S-box-containing protein
VSARDTQQTTARGTVVVADDDAATRLLLCQILKREHFNVIAVENGKLACEAAHRERPDVILLDMMMPVMSGREAIDELKTAEDTRAIPIVMLTAQSDLANRVDALSSGAQDVLAKPFEAPELIARIEAQMKWRSVLAINADAAFVVERIALLTASERRYCLLAEAMPSMVWIADSQNGITYYNRSWYDYTGMTCNTLHTADWIEFIHPDDRARYLAASSSSLLAGTSYEVECRLRRASDRTYRWHVGRVTAVRASTDAIVEWVGSFADIQDYKIASKTRDVLDTVPHIVCIHDDEGCVDYVNARWTEFTGNAAAAGLGDGWLEFIHPDDRVLLASQAAERKQGTSISVEAELRIRASDGRYRWFLMRTVVLAQDTNCTRRWVSTSTDIDDSKCAQAALISSEARYRALASAIPQLVWILDHAGRFVYVNDRWSRYTGLDLERSLAVSGQGVIDSDDFKELRSLCENRPLSEFQCEIRIRGADGRYRCHLVRGVPVPDTSGQSGSVIVSGTDIEDRKVAEGAILMSSEKLRHLAHHDTITALPNRVLLLDRLAAAIAIAQRRVSEVLVLYIDLDHFKAINDTLGHAAGDFVLQQVAKRLSSELRAGDTVGRVGGDEFVVVCANVESAQTDAAALAQRLIASISQPIDFGGTLLAVGASVGISVYPTCGLGSDVLIERADSAMYVAKKSGQNTFRFAEKKDDSPA